MNTAFSHALRLVVCPGCGAALHASVEGCELTCASCDSVFRIGPRVEAAQSEAIDEATRLERLAQRDPEPIAPPADVKELVARGELPDDKAEAAMEAWQKTRAELADGGEEREEAARRFYFLTRLIYERLVRHGEDRQVRAVLETALEVVGHPRYRQTFRCMLACEAARVGDLTAAEDWLEPCDAGSTDIHADSIYRYTSAYVATHQRNWARVIDVLGATYRDLPLASSFDLSCTVLRAHAHEKREDMPAAVYELMEGMIRLPDGADQIRQFIRSNRGLELCRRSYGKALGRVTEGEVSATTERRSAGPVDLRKILPWVVLSLACFGLAVGVESPAGTSLPLAWIFLGAGALFVVPIVIVVLRARSSRAG